MPSIDDIYVEVRLEQQQLKKDFQNAQSFSEKSAKSIENTYRKAKPSIDATQTSLKNIKGAIQNTDAPIKKMGTNFLNLIGVMVLFRQAWNFTKEVKNAARDAIETQNKFNEVFKGIGDAGEEAVDRLKKGFDLARTTSRDLLSNTGDLLVGLKLNREEALNLAEQVVALSSDVASFKNVQGGAERAANSLTKALLGEREMLKETFKTAVLESEVMERSQAILIKRTDLTLQQAKALATLQIVTERNKDAIGDYSRTKDELANVERRVNEELKESKERLGNEVIPLFKIFLSYILQTANNMGGLNGELTAFGAAAKSISTPLIILFTLLKQIGNILGVTGASFVKLINRDFAGLAKTGEIGFDLIVKDFEIMSKSLVAIWTDTSKKINNTPIVVGGNGSGGGDSLTKNVKKTIGDIKKEIESLQRVQDSLIPGSKEFAANLKEVERLTKIITDATLSTDAQQKNLIDKIKTEVELKELTYKLSKDVLQSAMDTLNAQLAVVEKERDSTENQKKKVELLKAINELLEKQKELDFEFEPQIDTDAVDKAFDEEALNRAKERQDIEKESVKTITQLRLDAIDDEFEKKKEIIELEREEALKNLYGLALTESELKEAQNNIDKKYANDLADLTTQKFSAGLSAARSIASSLSTIVGTGNAFVDTLQKALQVAEAIAAAIQAVKIISTVLGIPIAKTGGEFAHGAKVASYNSIPKFASGGEFNVPSKYTNDSFLMRVSNDEKVKVTPANKVGDTEKLLSIIAGRIGALNQSVSNLETNVTLVNNAPDVQTTVRRNKRVENNLIRQGVKFNES